MSTFEEQINRMKSLMTYGRIDESDKKVKVSKKERIDNINKIEEEMRKAAAELDFERAMELRDIWLEMKSE